MGLRELLGSVGAEEFDPSLDGLNAHQILQLVYRGKLEVTPMQMRALSIAINFESPKLAVIGHVAEDGSFAERLERALMRSGHSPPKRPPKLITYNPEHRPAEDPDV
jgi:hypothetical protein